MEDQIATWVGYAAGALFGARYLLGAVAGIADAIDQLDGSRDWSWPRRVANAADWLDGLLDTLPVKPLGRRQ